MIPYDEAFDPPAPVADIEIYRADQPSRRVRARALLDTGADICVLPAALVTELNVAPDGLALIASYTGQSEEVRFYQLNLETERLLFRRIKFVESDVGMAILGRNALNLVNISLKGPEHSFEVLPS